MNNRIRAVRKAKGLTLAELGKRARPPTTAQTIGRLETGERKLTLDWLEKIAGALDVQPLELLEFHGDTDIPIAGTLAQNGRVTAPGAEALRLSAPGQNPVALKVAVKAFEFEIGDTVVCEQSSAPDFADCLGKECLITLDSGERRFGRLLHGSAPGLYTVIPPGEDGAVYYDIPVTAAARRSMLIRYY